ncbi:aryl hydrocarbon receptor-like [Dromiciops gliroides]|uniref:aryl hydrocarbon receptor-like n=1 Tax=Dromiciops gliroides TaxID=33562 RepID=UPI001CC4C9D8|nr:aryl hydrocarbon receptor-like [Dromiciops gliroides]
MLPTGGVYAVKKRKKPVPKSPKPPPPEGTKSNPSKRHRDRLNQELGRLTNLLPFPEDVRARLDKLSILRLAVGYLKVKGYFTAILKNPSTGRPDDQSANSEGSIQMPPHINQEAFSEGELLLQALHGFFIAVTADGYIFYVSPTIQDYLGFHQSDVIYQSVFELIHTDDRAMFRCQLHWSLNPPSFREAEQDSSSLPGNESSLNSGTTTYDPKHLPPENSSFLERSFVCRFRCLLDNSSGFMALDFHGRLKFLYGQNKKEEDGSLMPPQLALFAIAVPLQPLSILELRTKIYLFQTKHKLDFTPMACDARGKVLLGYTETELCMRGSGYQFIHAADMMYCAEKHVRMMKTGESGMTIFRLLTKKAGWLWVQANARLVYKGGQPDCIIARQRVLSNEEGEDHLHKRATSQLPFNFATGEAVLYENNIPHFLSSLPPRKEFKPKKEAFLDHDPVDPNSLLGAMMQQDESAYISRTVSAPSFSFTDAMQAPREWCPSDKNGKIIKDETDSLLTIIETLFEKNEAENDICKTIQNLDVDDLELQKWEESMFPVNQVGSPSFQGRLQQGVTPFMDKVLLSPKSRKHMDFAPLNITTSLQSLRQQAPLMGPSHQTRPMNPLQYLFMNPSKEKDAVHPQECYWHSLDPETVDHLPPRLQGILPDLPQQTNGQAQEGPLIFGMCQDSMATPKTQAASGQTNPMPISSHRTSWHPLEPSSDNSTAAFPPTGTSSLPLEKAGSEKEKQHSSGGDASAQSFRFQTHAHSSHWQDPEPASAHQGPPRGTKPRCSVDSLTLREPMEVEAQFQIQRAQPNALGSHETSPWTSSRLADYPHEDIQGMGITPLSSTQQAHRTTLPCYGQQPTPLEGHWLPGGYPSCWPNQQQQQPSPVLAVYSEQQEFSTQHQQHLGPGTDHSAELCRPALEHRHVLLTGEAGPSVHQQTAPDQEASYQRERMLQTTQRSSVPTIWQNECLLSSPEYPNSMPTMERDISPQVTQGSPFLGSCHLSSKLGEASPSCMGRLTNSTPGREARLELDWSLHRHPSDPPFSHTLLEQPPDGWPVFSYDVHCKPTHRSEESSTTGFPASAHLPKT